MKLSKILLGALTVVVSPTVFAQNTQATLKSQMRYVATFEAGQPGASIYKLYDASDDVICYILMPDTAIKKQVDGKLVYEGNTLGSLSCLKANSPVASSGKK
jgi:hypothetical protein